MPKGPKKKKPSSKQKPENVVEFTPLSDDIDDASPFDRDFIENLAQRMATFEDGMVTPLDMALEIMSDAWEEEEPLKRFAMAQMALEISPDCTEAYILLAQESTPSLRYEIEMLVQAVEAAERVLGPEPFQDSVGYFWNEFETRPYVQARTALAHALWDGGHDEDALAHAKDLLRLNPGDNLGMRYSLIHWLIETQRDAEAWQLLEEYPDDASAIWFFSRALLEYRKGGSTKKSRAALDKAIACNEHVPDYLRGRQMPEEEPAFYSPGDEREAVMYCAGAFQSWYRSPGALEWLQKHAK